MTVSQQEYALLALDSYNGEGASTPHIVQSGWTRIVLNPPYDELNPEFAAAAYTNGDQVVIAYRGTNGTIELLNDAILNSVTGVPSTQILDAYNFYKAVEALHSDKTISFTGHSLGGSLAAIMSAHTGLDAQVFAPVPYEGAAQAISSGYTWYISDDELGPIDELGDIPERTNPNSSPFSGIQITTVEGEVAGLLPGAPTPHLTLQSALNLTSIQKHSMALHSLILYGDDTGGSWRNVGEFLSELFNAEIAEASGYSSDPWYDNLFYGGAVGKLMSAVGLTAGTDAKVVDGLFADANLLGDLELNEAASAVNDLELQKNLIQVAIQYAGHVSGQSGENKDTDGILVLADDAISVDISGTLWGGSEIVGVSSMWQWIEETIAGGALADFFGTNDPSDQFERIIIEANGGESIEFTDSIGLDDIVIGGFGEDRLDGGDGDDLLIGGYGDDFLVGGLGSEFVWGGNGSDTVDYSGLAGTIDIRLGTTFLDAEDSGSETARIVVIETGAFGEYTDHLFTVEKVIGTEFNDRLLIDGRLEELFDSIEYIDLGGNSGGQGDVLDLTGYGGAVVLTNTADGLVIRDKITGRSLTVKGVETVKLTNYDDVIDDRGGSPITIFAGGGPTSSRAVPKGPSSTAKRVPMSFICRTMCCLPMRRTRIASSQAIPS